ncbi:hypothetical protein EVJ58_g8325 [Rhodofomes roseus]|uniref:MYND-type domain-containing protein n=1 Tax=Rhodofomes roseus TaxID=34475 RepID=A0A4Y9XYS3_9APHY|nr:hypothetical protein EVJ58_g8325 [Rhodofomes roseus]
MDRLDDPEALLAGTSNASTSIHSYGVEDMDCKKLPFRERAYPGATVPGLLPMSEDASPIEKRWAILSAMPKTHLPVCLPQALLDDLRLRINPDFYSERSLVFGRDALHARTFPMRHFILSHYVIQAGDAYAMVDESWADQNDTGDLEWSLPKLISPESGSTYLHFAVRLFDVPFVYECIRLGADVNFGDAEGRTPLYCAMEELCTFINMAARFELLGETPYDNPELFASKIARLRYIVKLLVEQHANMQLVPTSNVVLACMLPEDMRGGLLAVIAWICLDLELLELFALHGFPLSPLSTLDTVITPPFLEQSDPGKAYPEKVSLCRELVLCEAEAEGQAPTYVSFRSHTPGVPSGQIWPDTGKKKSWELLIMAIEYNDTQSEEKADPAFRAAALISEYLPLPGVDWGSKVWGKEVASFWNRIVDDYIALGTDTRSKSNIGRAAKLDPFFLPLWKRCEATGCTKIDRPGLTMKRCRGCQRIFYCGPMCQKAHWKEHKPACQRGDHPLQLLRSQTIYKTILKEVIEPAEERLLHDAIDSENSKSDGADSESSNLKSDDADSDN